MVTFLLSFSEHGLLFGLHFTVFIYCSFLTYYIGRVRGKFTAEFVTITFNSNFVNYRSISYSSLPWYFLLVLTSINVIRQYLILIFVANMNNSPNILPEQKICHLPKHKLLFFFNCNNSMWRTFSCLRRLELC